MEQRKCVCGCTEGGPFFKVPDGNNPASFERVDLDFSPDYASFANMTISDQIQELARSLQSISEELQQQVREKHGALLQQATHAGRFDAALSTLSEDVQRIRSTSQRLKSQIDAQYGLMENQTRVLSRLHELSHLLRSSGTLLNLTSKLKNSNDVLKQADTHFELGQLIEDKDLKNIKFIQRDRSYVIGSRQKIKNLTQMQLVTGLKERNVTQVMNALKIFLNFNNLDKSLENLIITYISELEQSLKECFAGTDISILSRVDLTKSSVLKSSGLRGPGKTPQLTTTQNFRSKFWKSLHWLLYDELFEFCEQIKLLEEALEQINNFTLISQTKQSIHKRFWTTVQNLLRKSFAECPAHVSQALQEGLSKLLSSARGLEHRLNKEFLFDQDIFTPLEVGYISKCAANMKACFASVDLPSNDTVDNFIRVASTELSAALIDTQLTDEVAAVFIACGKELCTKIETQIKLSVDSKQVVDLPNIQQIQNTILANILFYYKDSVCRMLIDLQGQFIKTSPKAQQAIAHSLEQANLLMNTILQQIINSIISTINIILLSMHREPGIGTDSISSSGPSMYMKELQEFLLRTWVNHIQPFDDKQIINKCGLELAKRCIELFLHNISILRPLSNTGRNRLKNDCAFMEQLLKPICPNISDLGNSARLLRAMSFLIVQKPSELVKQAIGKDSLVPSYIVLFLLFGHADAELQSPHTAANWSNERLIDWLEGHTSEREKLELILGALQRYRDNIRRKKIEKYDEVYPLLFEYFERALEINT